MWSEILDLLHTFVYIDSVVRFDKRNALARSQRGLSYHLVFVAKPTVAIDDYYIVPYSGARTH